MNDLIHGDNGKKQEDHSKITSDECRIDII